MPTIPPATPSPVSRPLTHTLRDGVSGAYQVSLPTKIAYSIGALSDSLKTFSFGLFLLFFYTSVAGLPGTLLGVAMSLGLVWDSLLDPLIGHVSDRAQFRFGRRHAFMLVGAGVAGASFCAVFNPPPGLTEGTLFAWLLAWNLCLRLGHSCFMVPYYALGSELTPDYEERTSISGFRAGAALGGTLLAAAAAFLVFFPGAADGVDRKFSRDGYSWMGLTFGAAITLAGLVATVGTLGERRLADPPDRRQHAAPFLQSLREAGGNASFRALVISGSLFFLGSMINASLAMHFLTYRARVSINQSFSVYFAAFYIGALAGVVLWMQMAHRIEKHRLYAGACLVTAAVMAGAYWLIGEGRPFGVGHLPLLVIGNATAGLVSSALWVIAPSMMADVAAQDELQSGRRRDGAFFGVYSFGQQMSAGLAVLIAGVLVDRFAGLVPGQIEQTTRTIDRLAILFSLLPAGLLVLSALAILRYRLTRRRVAEIQQALASQGSGVSDRTPAG